ncbi:hypothetical protein BAE44_0025629 [Dichanthelium oligosanthes]|uniref:Pectinesterase inhibitor domain-containing protein n=1 Tax=Dichanthelium oligosanthes TaxID=888268 RepID=A0A1E5UKG1_9POAL|nr:hypothetical protein BAE44_0025629 [Dichanthelium oligosanthes]
MASKSIASLVFLLLAMVLMLAVTSQAQAPAPAAAPTLAPTPAPAPSQRTCPSIFNSIRDLEKKAKQLEHQFFFAYFPAGSLNSNVNSIIARLQPQHPTQKICVCFPYLAFFGARNIRCLGSSA